MEVEVICFNLARLTGVVYCGSLLLLMASNSSNGAHLLSFHPPSLHWWGWPNIKNLKNAIYLCEISATHSYLALERTDGAPWLYACACTCTVSEFNIRLSGFCVRPVRACLSVCARPKRESAVCGGASAVGECGPQTPSALGYQFGKSNKASGKREVLIIMLYGVKLTRPRWLDLAVWLMISEAGALSRAFWRA